MCFANICSVFLIELVTNFATVCIFQTQSVQTQFVFSHSLQTSICKHHRHNLFFNTVLTQFSNTVCVLRQVCCNSLQTQLLFWHSLQNKCKTHFFSNNCAFVQISTQHFWISIFFVGISGWYNDRFLTYTTISDRSSGFTQQFSKRRIPKTVLRTALTYHTVNLHGSGVDRGTSV